VTVDENGKQARRLHLESARVRRVRFRGESHSYFPGCESPTSGDAGVVAAGVGVADLAV
jgi:hypothetical protein